MLDELSFRFEWLRTDEAAFLLVGVIDADVVSKILDGFDQDHGTVPVLEGAFHPMRPRLGVDHDVVGRFAAVGEGCARHHGDTARVVHAHHVFHSARRGYKCLKERLSMR